MKTMSLTDLLEAQQPIELDSRFAFSHQKALPLQIWTCAVLQVQYTYVLFFLCCPGLFLYVTANSIPMQDNAPQSPRLPMSRMLTV